MGAFCFLCGKRTEKLIEGYCEECYNKKFSLIELPKSFSITACSKCDLVKIANKWQKFEPEKFFKQKSKICGKIDKLEIKKQDNVFKIICSGYLNGSEKLKEEMYEVCVKLNKIICPACSRLYGGYYEAILQLRGKISSNILDFISKKSRNLLLTDKKAFYRVEQKKEGINIYFGSKGSANHIALELKNRFGCEIKRSFKLFTKKDGRDVYRNVILIRI